MRSLNPRVSVLMPVYNAETYLREAIDSILCQSFKDFEFVIINDGSTDSSVEIIESYIDDRIKLIHNASNVGLIKTLNIGLEVCKGEYIVRMDSDDISLPTRIALQVGFMDSNPAIGVLGSWFEDFGEHIEPKIVKYATSDSEIRIRHLYQTHIAHPTAVIRTNLIHKYGLKFDPEYVYGEDYHFWVKVSANCKLSNYPEVLVKKRDHPKNITNSFSDIMHRTCTKVKIGQFEAMGVRVNVEEADLYTRFADPEWQFSIIEMNQLLHLITQLNEANQVSKFIEPADFSTYLASKWFHLCFHNKNLLGSGWKWFKRLLFHHYYKPTFVSSARIRLRNLGIPV